MCDQTLEQYRRLKKAGSEAWLIVGPWTHTSMFNKGYLEVVPRAVEEFRTRLSASPVVPPVRRSACTSAAAASGAACPSGRHRRPARCFVIAPC